MSSSSSAAGRVQIREQGLVDFPASVYQERDLIRSLDASRNQIAKLNKKFISAFKQEAKSTNTGLLELDLSFNTLTKLPSSFSDLRVTLQHLDLSFNQLKSFPSSLLKLDRLRFLSLKCNNIAAVPDAISKMVSLEVLLLSDNPLGSKFDLGKGINRLLLDRLELSNCGLESLSPTLGELKSLKLLDLSNNKLTVLPDCVGQLQNLESLSLAHNQLNSLPLSVGMLRKLDSLELGDNPWAGDPDIQAALSHRLPDSDDASSSSSSVAASSCAASSSDVGDAVSASGEESERTTTKIETSACQRVQLLQRQRMRRDPTLRLLLFEEKEHRSNIEIRFKVKGDPNSGSDIVQSTPEKLVLYLTRYQPPEKGFFKTVHLTWSYWTDAVDLLDLLQIRFHAAADSSDPSNPVNNVIRLRTLNFFRKWLEGLAETCTVVDAAVEQKIAETIELLGTAGQSIKESCLSLAEQIRHNDERLLQLRADYDGDKDEPNVSSLATTSVFLLETSPRQLAEHELIIEFEMWKAIPITEFLHQNWTKPETDRAPPPARHLLRLIRRFNRVSAWVGTELVKVTKDKKLRVRVLCQLILVAQECLHVSNYNALFAIMSGLNSAACSRLKETWAALPDKTRDVYARLQTVIDNSGNFANYRKLVSGETTICLPYVGRMLQDMTFIEDGNPNIIPGTDLINFHKFLMIGEQLQQIETMQQNCPLKPGDYKEDPQIRSYLLNLQTFAEEELYHASLMCEASSRRRTNSSAVMLELRSTRSATHLDVAGRRLSDSPSTGSSPGASLVVPDAAGSGSPRTRSSTVDVGRPLNRIGSGSISLPPSPSPLSASSSASSSSSSSTGDVDDGLFRSNSTTELNEQDDDDNNNNDE